MGLTIKADLDTSKGSSEEVYIRIESLRVNKVNGEMEFTTTCWVHQDAASGFHKTYVGDNIGSGEGMIKREVIFYKDEEDMEGTEVTLPNHFKVTFSKDIIEETPVFDERPVEVEVPYISFDANGNEVEKVKTVTKINKVQVDSIKENKTIIDYESIDRPFVFAYNHIKKELEKLFTGALIE